MKILTFRDLEVWQKSMSLVESCYAVTSELPDTERYELGRQIRRAAVSIPSNIAEGHQLPRGAYRHHVSIALGSVAELQTQVELTRRLRLLGRDNVEDIEVQLRGVRQMLLNLRTALR